jgi:hypothetical protein
MAGMILNLIDGPNSAVISAKVINEFMLSHNVTPNPLVGPYFAFIHLLYGIMMVWLYAILIPKYGIGKKTAFISLIYVFIVKSLLQYGFVVMGLLSNEIFIRLEISALIGYIFGGIVGAWYYSRK